jgi:hypothetical protein
LNRRFELVPTGAGVLRGRGQFAFRLCDHRGAPTVHVLFGKRDVPAVRRSARRSPCFAVEHQRQQPAHLRLGWHPLPQHAREPERFVGQAPRPRIGTGGVLPTAAVGGVDGVEHRIEPLR